MTCKEHWKRQRREQYQSVVGIRSQTDFISPAEHEAGFKTTPKSGKL
jgi:hypothetical protein